MDARDLFSHLNRFDAGIITASKLWNYLSDNRDGFEEVLDDEEQDVFDTAELVMAEYTGGHLSETDARARLRRLLDEQGQLPYLQAPPDLRARAGN
jgi:hypothetical protein